MWGIDHQINTDENKLVVPSVKMARGEQQPLLYPKGTYYPHLYHYILAGTFLPVTLLHPALTFDNYYTNVFLLIGRITTAVLGAATIFPLYGLLKPMSSKRTALLACVLLAILPIHVKYSHYAHVDAPLAFFTTLALLAAQRTWVRGKATWYILTGIFVGLSGAVLYTGLVMGIALLFAHGKHWRAAGYSWRTLLRPAFIIGLVAIPLTFIITSPYSLLERHEVWQTYQRINERAAAGDLGYTRTSLVWPLFNSSLDWGIPFTSASIFTEFNPLIMLFAAIGLLLVIWRKQWQLVALLGGTAVVAYLAIAGYVRMSAIKRFLPLAPLAAALAAVGIAQITRVLRLDTKWQNLVQAALVILIVAPSLYHVIGFDRAYAHGSTHIEAVAWTRSNLPKGTTILQHGPLVLLPPDDPDYRIVKLGEVYANFNVQDPEVSHDRAKPLDDWIEHEQIDVVYLDARMVNRYWDATSVALYPETTASYRAFYEDIRRRGKLLYHIVPALNGLAGPEVELYDVSHLQN